MRIVFTAPKLVPRSMRKIASNRTTVIKSNNKGRLAAEKLKEFLNTETPRTAEILQKMYSNQKNAITYAELREAVVNGYMSEDTFRTWQEDYSRFVVQHLEPLWKSAIRSRASELEAALRTKPGGFYFDPTERSIQDWISKNGARWVTNQSLESRKAIKAMLSYASSGAYTPDELARIIRPTIGLTTLQADANRKYYDKVKRQLEENHPRMKQGAIEKKAREAALKYAEKQQRERAKTIANTELSMAYHQGMDEAIKQAQKQGIIGPMKRRWLSCPTDPCELCVKLGGQTIDMNEEFEAPMKTDKNGNNAPMKWKSLFPGSHAVPPAHPRCHCGVEYIEVSMPESSVITPFFNQESSQKPKPSEQNNDNYIFVPENGDNMSKPFVGGDRLPKYGHKDMVTVNNNKKTTVERVMNSHYDMFADAEKPNTKAVKLTERLLTDISDRLPLGVVIPPVAVLDFKQNDINGKVGRDAIGMYDRNSNMLFLNSIYDTENKIVDFVTRNDGYFANQTVYAPLLHELGHARFEILVKSIAKKHGLSYNKAKELIHQKMDEVLKIYKFKSEVPLKRFLSNYAHDGMERHLIQEVYAEAFSIENEDNDLKDDILQVLYDLLKG